MNNKCKGVDVWGRTCPVREKCAFYHAPNTPPIIYMSVKDVRKCKEFAYYRKRSVR